MQPPKNDKHNELEIDENPLVGDHDGAKAKWKTKYKCKINKKNIPLIIIRWRN